MAATVSNRLRIATGMVALGAIVGASLAVAISAAAHAAYLVPSGRRAGYPGWMRGPFASHGGFLTLHGFMLLMAAMAVGWLVVLLCARALPAWAIPATAVVATLIFTLAPPLLSTDVFNYIAYGRLAQHGINPYLHGPLALKHDPVYAYTGHLWKRSPSAYGPLFTLLSTALAPLGVAAAMWALKVLAGLASLACAALIWVAAKRLDRPAPVAVALFALNPLVLVWAVGGAHNDLLMAAFVAASIVLALHRRAALSGAALATAVAIKLSAGLVAPFLLLGSRSRLRTLAGITAGAAAAAGVGLIAYGPAIEHMVNAVSADQGFPWIVVSVPGSVGHYLGLGPFTPQLRHALFGVFAAAVVVLIVRSRGGRGWVEGAAAATLVLLVTTGWLLPWYIVWLLPLVAVLPGRALPGAAVVLTLLMVGMQVDHFRLTHGSHHRAPHHRLAQQHAREQRSRHVRS
jgi:alpha-1,6-mannosyltransferase